MIGDLWKPNSPFGKIGIFVCMIVFLEFENLVMLSLHSTEPHGADMALIIFSFERGHSQDIHRRENGEG